VHELLLNVQRYRFAPQGLVLLDAQPKVLGLLDAQPKVLVLLRAAVFLAEQEVLVLAYVVLVLADGDQRQQDDEVLQGVGAVQDVQRVLLRQFAVHRVD